MNYQLIHITWEDHHGNYYIAVANLIQNGLVTSLDIAMFDLGKKYFDLMKLLGLKRLIELKTLIVLV